MCTRVFLITGQQYACSVPIKLSGVNSNLGHRLANGKIAATRQFHLVAKNRLILAGGVLERYYIGMKIAFTKKHLRSCWKKYYVKRELNCLFLEC